MGISFEGEAAIRGLYEDWIQLAGLGSHAAC
jgi:hypothetical protein